MLTELRPSLAIMVAMTLLTGLAYPLAMTGIAEAVFPDRARGSLIVQDGRVVGSSLIGQAFAGPGYFHPRPSAAGKGYAADNSGGSNLAPTSRKLVAAIRTEAADLSAANGGAPVPIDMLTASGSGLDPDISPAAALFQVPRVAAARGLSIDAVRRLVAQNTEERSFGVLGEPRVNVLRLNLALDAQQSRR
jgi:K+-transporting ATPase ATPase C chain